MGVGDKNCLPNRQNMLSKLLGVVWGKAFLRIFFICIYTFYNL